MKAAPYTPQTLTRIRNGATPFDLGWDASFYSSVCRKHGLSPNVLRRPSAIETATPPIAPEISCAQASQPKKRKPERTDTRARGHTFAISKAMQRLVIQASCDQDISYSDVIRAAMQAAAESKEALPPWRATDNDRADANMAVTLTPDEFDAFSRAARWRKLILQEFIRRTIAVHVPTVKQ